MLVKHEQHVKLYEYWRLVHLSYGLSYYLGPPLVVRNAWGRLTSGKNSH